MKASEVYLRAAEDIADGRLDWSCSAITIAADTRTALRCQNKMRKWFYSRYNDQSTLFWMSTLDEVLTYGASGNAEIRSRRVLALLFMHQIALDEERGK